MSRRGDLNHHSLSVSDCVGYSTVDSMESITDEAQKATLLTKLT